MKLFKFLEDEFQRANLEMQKEYTPFEKSKTKAISKILAHQSSLYTFFLYFYFLLNFLKNKIFGFREPIDFNLELTKLAEERKRISKDEECAQNVVPMTTQN